MGWLAVFLVMLVSIGAAHAQQSKPCERGPQSLRLAGVDPDVTRCQIFIMQQAIGNAETRAADAAANAELTTKDLATARSQSEKREKEWGDYFAAYIGAHVFVGSGASWPTDAVTLPTKPAPGLARPAPPEHKTD